MKHAKIEYFVDFIRDMDIERYSRGFSPTELLLQQSGPFTVDYAPMEYVASDAKLVILGLTPGRTQATNALRSVQREVRRGVSIPEALRIAKSVASFSGGMRNSLVAMLDHIGVADKFERKSTSEFFHGSVDDVHFTSCLRYPVYLNGRNYSGTPRISAAPQIERQFDELLSAEAASLRNALWVPLGTYAQSIATMLSTNGTIDEKKVLIGLPHPSGANAERIAYFLGRKPKERLSAKTNSAKIDRQRTKLIAQVGSL